MTATIEAEELVTTEFDTEAGSPPVGWSVVWSEHGWSEEDGCPMGTCRFIGRSQDPEEVVGMRDRAQAEGLAAGWPGRAYVTDCWGGRCRMLEEAMIA